jgi:hypothetical protein
MDIQTEFKKLPLSKLYISSFVISISSIAFGLVFQFLLPPEIPLYYGLPQTEGQIAPSITIILPSMVSIFIIFINTLIAIKVSSNYLKKILSFTSLAVSVLAIITTFKICFLVGSF